MARIFKGRSILPEAIEGEAVVTRSGFSTLACFYKSIITQADNAICGDQNNPDIYDKELKGKIICLPTGIGSTSAGATWDAVVKMGVQPKAMLFSETIDSLNAAGLIIADIWQEKRICTVDRLGDEFLDCVKTGQQVHINTDGTVTVIS